ncbi:MAG: cytochrome b [Rhodospirillaceae bacterium]
MFRPPDAYNRVAQSLHWLAAACILSAIPMGAAMTRVGPGPLQNTLFDLHRSMGFVVLVLMLIRIAWRVYSPPPPRQTPLPRWQSIAAESAHGILYLGLILNPLIGWIGTNAFPAPIKVFGLFTLPTLVEKDRALSELLLTIHEYLSLFLAAVILVHIAAALQHHFIKKDDTLRRMLPW